jgi:hypothetical protein
VGFSVTGRLPPTIVKPFPVATAEFTITGPVPVDVSVKLCVVALFTVTLPKLRFVVLTVSCELVCGFDVVVLPVPLRATVAVPPFDELLLIAI